MSYQRQIERLKELIKKAEIRIDKDREKIKTYQTDMLLVQGKVKVLSQESTMQKKEDILKGEKLTDKLEEEWVKELLEKQVINQDEENFSKYYIWNKDVLNDVGLQDIKLENSFYIV